MLIKIEARLLQGGACLLDKGGGGGGIYMYMYVCTSPTTRNPLSQEGANEETRKKNIST